MPWIDTIHEDDATGDLAELYDQIEQSRGKLSNILRVHSLHPEALRGHLELYDALLFGRSPLRRAEREAIAVVVSVANGCAYCTRHHAEALHAYWRDADRVERFVDDYTQVDDLSARLRAACNYAVALTQSADGTSNEDVAALREAGWDDQAILDIALITAYFNFVNRIANGLGVSFTDTEATGYNY